MEFEDIIYLILLGFFMIMGFFNDSRKKKDKQKQQAEKPSRPNSGQPSRPFFETSGSEWEEELPWLEPRPADKAKVMPPAPPVVRNEEGKTVFQSSMDLTTDFTKESSLKDSIFVYDADVSYDKDPDAMDISEMADSYLQTTTGGEKRISPHPLLAGLYGDTSREELLKGLIIGDIMRRKY